MDYSVLLKEIRTKLIISQTELASMVGVSYLSVNRWENGKCVPTIKARRRIKELCDQNGIEISHE